MKNHWQHIWSKRSISDNEKLGLQSLLAVDGFDTGYGGIQEAVWHDYLHSISTQIKITEDNSIFEVGCGAGAFLYLFYQKGYCISGIDYSANLVKTALSAMPKAQIIAGEASQLRSKKQFDIVVANSVFHYFPSYEYAEIVLRSMVKKARKSVGIFDMLDIEHQEKAIALRKADLGEEEYEQKYRGLDYLCFSRNWFRSVFSQEAVKLEIKAQNIRNYGNSPYRFNVFAYK